MKRLMQMFTKKTKKLKVSEHFIDSRFQLCQNKILLPFYSDIKNFSLVLIFAIKSIFKLTFDEEFERCAGIRTQHALARVFGLGWLNISASLFLYLVGIEKQRPMDPLEVAFGLPMGLEVVAIG